jgi:signal transduction histidine kinase
LTGKIEVRIGVDPDLPGLERAAGSFVTLEVRDNGPGVDPTVRDRIFDPFFTTREKGFGMGLAIVHRIVDLHGGVVWVHSTPGGADLPRRCRASNKRFPARPRYIPTKWRKSVSPRS